MTQPNQGTAAARIAGAKIAQADFIIFCDADIVLKPEMLETMVATLKKSPQASYAYCAFKFGQKTFKLWPFSAEKLKKIPYIHTTSLIRKKHFTGFDKNLKRFQDWDLWLTMLEKGYTGKFIPEILFTVVPGGTMSHWLPKVFYKFSWFKKVKEYRRAEKIIKQKHNLES